MINLIYGSHTAQSRNFFYLEKQKVQNPIIFFGETITLTDLAQALNGNSLFEETKNIFIENFLSKKKKGKEKDAIISFLNQHNSSHQIFIWESIPLTPSQIAEFKNTKTNKFDIPKSIFTMLDALVVGNGQKAIAYFHEVLKSEEPEFVFFMIVRHFRILLALSEPGEPISETTRLSTWQKSKLEKSASLFGKEVLLTHYQTLFSIEKSMKTGTLSISLPTVIDFFLLGL